MYPDHKRNILTSKDFAFEGKFINIAKALEKV